MAGKEKKGIVLTNELLIEYYKFRGGNEANRKLIKKLFNYFKDDLLTNYKQVIEARIELPRNVLVALIKAKEKNMPLEELRQLTDFKLVLSASNDNYPYININKDVFENNLTCFFESGEVRIKAIKHIKDLCSNAKEIILFDKFFSKDTRNLDAILSFLPNSNLKFHYFDTHISDEDILILVDKRPDFCIEKKEEMHKFHDRYLIIDNKIEIILTSGFLYLTNENKELGYIVRKISNNRFFSS